VLENKRNNEVQETLKVIKVLWIGIVLMPIRIRMRVYMKMLIQIRTWIGTNIMPILTRILPQVLHMFKNQIFLLLVTALLVYNVLGIFLKFQMCHNFLYFGPD
jgi:hypothetical protein